MSLEIKIFTLIDGKDFKPNLSLSDEEVQTWLSQAWAKSVIFKAKILSRKQNRNITETLLQAASEFKLSDIATTSTDEIEEEALSLAELEITTQLAKDGLPPPRNIRDHAIMALSSSDRFYEKAKQRLMARAEVVAETLG